MTRPFFTRALPLLHALALVCIAGAVLHAPGCSNECVTKTGNPGDCGGGPGLPGVPGGIDNPLLEQIALECGIDINCEGELLAEGNAAISGVPSIDAFFQSVLNLRARADALDATLAGELDAIRATFDIEPGADLAAELSARFDANLEGGLTATYSPPTCTMDARAVIEATARCDASVDVGSATAECSGSCVVSGEADVDCGPSAELVCTFALADAACDGECTCAEGSDCSAVCTGECTVVDPAGGCDGAMRAVCRAMGDAVIACDGRCDGEVRPPMASAECQASAQAEAAMAAECGPARVELEYTLRSDLDAETAASFRAAMRSLELRLPALFAAAAQADVLVDVAADLAASASGSVEGAVDAASDAAGEGNLQVLFGVQCAVGQLGAVPGIVNTSAASLEANVSATASLSSALGL